MVGLPVKQTVAPSTYGQFQTVLNDAWSQYSAGRAFEYLKVIYAITNKQRHFKNDHHSILN